MSWKKYFNPVKTTSNTDGVYSPMGNGMRTGKAGPARTNYSSYLPDIYIGSPNRVERYGQYNTMDLDSEVNAALDILAEFCTQKNKGNRTTFYVDFLKKATHSEVSVIHQYLQQWFKLQKFETRIFRILRNIFKYGDAFFLRDPETKKWFHIDPAKVVRIIVNESEGKVPEQYVIKDVNINFKEMVATSPLQTTGNVTGGGGGYYQGGVRGMVGTPQGANALGSRFQLDQDEVSIDSRHVVHISLSEGLDNNYPFGNSLLETIFKVYKQKELLEDAIIIYRVQRAPERRVFYVDVGNMPSHLAMQFVERVKTEIHQRRIPSQQGGSTSLIDSSYNPLCLDLDTKIPLLDGRTLKLSELITEFENGKENWAYSCNPETGEVVPGVINWAGITRENAEVIKLTFDNGEHLICTPDHKIPVFGKGFVEAQNIIETDSLISFNRKNDKISNKSNDYEKVWDHSKKDWVWTHRIVGEFFRNKNKHQEFTYLNEYKGSVKSVIHHKDYNRFNNDPRNLQYMNKKDHILYHAAQKEDYWKNMSNEKKDSISNKISNTLKENWKNMSKDDRLVAMYNIRKAQKRSVWMRVNDPEVKEQYKINAGNSRRKYLENNPKARAQLLKNLENKVKIKNQKLNLTFEMLQIVADIVKNQSTKKQEVIEICDNHQDLLDLVKRENSTPLDYKNAHCKIDFNRFGYSKLKRLISKFGYKNWKHFVKEVDQFNHKVVKIERVSNRTTGTITIDGTERWHDYHTFAIDSGIFIKNSINEDFFFPQTCLSLDTKIPLLDGRTLTLNEIIEETNNGKTNWVYGLNNKTHELEPAKIVWAGVTRKNADVIKITLDNGKEVIATPDHRFITRDGKEVEAKDLIVDQSLMPLGDGIRTIAKIENLTDKIDTGDITIESESNSHWFGLEAGIYVHNSEGRGSKVDTLPGGCFAMDTKVSLLDGRELSIREIENELKDGKELWCYSCEPKTGKIVPGLISWAGVTQKSAKVMKITLDNGEEIICTPDHKFPQYNKDFKEARDFKIGDSLIPLYRKKEYITKNKKLDYEKVFDNSEKEWVYTHRVVADYLKNTKVNTYIYDSKDYNLYEVRHHVDFNRYNNDPNNLCFMSWKDHKKLHQDYGFDSKSQRLGTKAAKEKLEYIKLNNNDLYAHIVEQRKQNSIKMWESFSSEKYKNVCKNISNGVKQYFNNLSLNEKEQRANVSRKNFKYGNFIFNKLMNENLEFRQSVLEKRSKYWNNENRKKRSKFMKSQNLLNWSGVQGEIRRKKQKELQSMEFSHDMITYVIDIIKDKSSHEASLSYVVKQMNKNSKLVNDLLILNSNKKIRNWRAEEGFTESNIKNLVRNFGYKNWKDFRQKESIHNHRIVNIEYLDEPIEVGTLTIDQDEIYHNYHTFALSCGVMTKNSNLGEIDDLRFFTNKMVRGLRIPSSYLPTGAEDSAAQYNDGRVGTAYIQELRFNTYCERLQSLVTEEFDQDFKRYLLEKGLNVDTSMFNLRFQPPQNFAAYRQTELDNSRITTFTTMMGVPFISNRYAMKRYLGMSEEEIAENERMWREENDDTYGSEDESAAAQMRSAGITDAGIGSDLGGLDAELPDMGGMETPPLEGEAPTSATEQPIGPGGGTPPPTGGTPA